MARRALTTAAAAGASYFGIAFAAGFVLGTLRVTLLAPRLGETAAILLELPLMLLITWIACRAIIKRWAVPATVSARIAMGAVALTLLLMAEAGLGIVAMGRTPAEHLARYTLPAEQLGLAAQLLFAIFPVLMLRRAAT